LHKFKYFIFLIPFLVGSFAHADCSTPEEVEKTISEIDSTDMLNQKKERQLVNQVEQYQLANKWTNERRKQFAYDIISSPEFNELEKQKLEIYENLKSVMPPEFFSIDKKVADLAACENFPIVLDAFQKTHELIMQQQTFTLEKAKEEK
jgi:hypothetical protein